MLTLNQFQKEFEKRHDFDSQDMNTLQYKYPKIRFKNIPEAWICNIDDMLLQINKIDKKAIKSVSQHCGFLCVEVVSKKIERVRGIIFEHEEKMYSVDTDLRAEIGESHQVN